MRDVPVLVPGGLLAGKGLQSQVILSFHYWSFDLAKVNNCYRIKFKIWNMNAHPESTDSSFLSGTG